MRSPVFGASCKTFSEEYKLTLEVEIEEGFFQNVSSRFLRRLLCCEWLGGGNQLNACS